jgi:hypothetical protein
MSTDPNLKNVHVLNIADELDSPLGITDDTRREAISDAATYLRCMHAEIELLKAENASYFEQYTAMRAERDALQEKPTTGDAERAAFIAAARPLIEYLNSLHPHHQCVVTSTGAELLEGRIGFETNEYLKD